MLLVLALGGAWYYLREFKRAATLQPGACPPGSSLQQVQCIRAPCPPQCLPNVMHVQTCPPYCGAPPKPANGKVPEYVCTNSMPPRCWWATP